MDVGPKERGEAPTCAQRRTFAAPEGELGVALGLLLECHGQHGPVFARLHMGRCDDTGGAADGAGGVNAENGLADSAERVGEIELRLHDALEQVRRLAEDDRVDVLEGHLGVVESAKHGFANETTDRDVPST